MALLCPPPPDRGHVSAFTSDADRAHFEADRSGKKYYDPAARSNTKFQTEVLRARYGFTGEDLDELVAWADIIDGAQFPDARTAVALEEPALRLMTFLEHNKDPALTLRYIQDIASRPLADVAAEPYVTGALGPVLARHEASITAIAERGKLERGVVSFDLVGTGIEAHNKFIAYMLFPDCRYTVGLTAAPARVKISVGSNPWPIRPRTHDIARICERYGGGGHPVVGAISLPPAEVDRGRAIVAEIVAELQRDF